MFSSTTPLPKPTALSVATVHLVPCAHLAPYVLGEKETRHVSPVLLVHIVLIAVHVSTVLVDISLYLHLGCLSTCPTHVRRDTDFHVRLVAAVEFLELLCSGLWWNHRWSKQGENLSNKQTMSW